MVCADTKKMIAQGCSLATPKNHQHNVPHSRSTLTVALSGWNVGCFTSKQDCLPFEGRFNNVRLKKVSRKGFRRNAPVVDLAFGACVGVQNYRSVKQGKNLCLYVGVGQS